MNLVTCIDAHGYVESRRCDDVARLSVAGCVFVLGLSP
jgi:hypothetical protein